MPGSWSTVGRWTKQCDPRGTDSQGPNDTNLKIQSRQDDSGERWLIVEPLSQVVKYFCFRSVSDPKFWSRHLHLSTDLCPESPSLASSSHWLSRQSQKLCTNCQIHISFLDPACGAGKPCRAEGVSVPPRLACCHRDPSSNKPRKMGVRTDGRIKQWVWTRSIVHWKKNGSHCAWICCALLCLMGLDRTGEDCTQ